MHMCILEGHDTNAHARRLVCNGRIFYLFILSYRARLSYLIMVLVLSSFLSMAVA